ncbi:MULTISPECIES: acyl carrier protein [Cyanophyceae]|uniref:Acyl carrier protein n=1 Tax=Picosynechococcus sp. (strain ATCC 27264 / PCC 7002 / PR-6) TaxID=32049 RepID=ACP_PICP2|nr:MULTISPECIES: acyl carrier protein [Cyanophyceae]B1XJG7.1 RecName: Full=Acyl carrier protein; Short=ACP [Picosynechococcus sp. PCC 7002]ACA99027.1 acyl carrier protein [Picosynechococcus sp. PCC 7002]AMA08772.1 acyl carrier protein [Picosynechococcus sp. PCC 73109]ANV83704.1 acyl carrier protein [Picosynechococcus sp. PCC 7003]ANV90074.1 acyl carrier protein [Picosynechococcus sp. PCC 8807]QCS49610.1 acyl carrier protein [Picosynechococcus sp. PCC 11901]
MNQEIFDKIKNIIVDQLDVDADSVSPESNFISDLDADSLDTVELVMAFEEEFDIDIPDDVAEKITTVGEAVNIIAEKTGAN